MDDLLELIDSLVKEKADIIWIRKFQERRKLTGYLEQLVDWRKNEVVYVVAQVDREVVANSEIRRMGGCSKHVGVVGIAIKNDYQNLGIGTEMIDTLIEQAWKMGLKVLMLSVFARNKRAIHVYEKAGFVRTGGIPKRYFMEGTYIDEIIMTKMLE